MYIHTYTNYPICIHTFTLYSHNAHTEHLSLLPSPAEPERQ